MATTNYSFNLPTVGGDEDAWGGLLNANWTALDTLLGGTNATEFAILDGATVTTAELNQLDGNTFTADVIPNADSTLDLGSSSAAWALAYLDAIEPVGIDTTIKRVGGTNTTPIVEGIAKAWVNFDGSGTISARDSFNVSSLTDNGTGSYTINFTNAFGAADYVAFTSATGGASGVYSNLSNTAFTTSSLNLFSIANDGTLVDIALLTASATGDLA